MEYTITENRLRKLFVNYMDSQYDLKYDSNTREFMDKDGEVFGHFLSRKSKHFDYSSYPTDEEYSLNQMFGELTNELLLYYLRERFPDITIDGIE
jgi:hypothetical protein